MKSLSNLSIIVAMLVALAGLALIFVGMGPSGNTDQRGDYMVWGAGLALFAFFVLLPVGNWLKERA